VYRQAVSQRTHSAWLDKLLSDKTLRDLMLAARAPGLDFGPMSGFDNAKLDEEFFAAGRESDRCVGQSITGSGGNS
jgi:nitroreductase